ncbi:MAG: SH3 domain-containing protein [Clostridia bacterium]|nr:SH3 domain-containing protein [Clostridia bacterium]
MKKLWICLIMALLLASAVSAAYAGSWPLVVATEGEGVPVYSSAKGRKQIGILYNGYDNELSLNTTNGRHSCTLTRDTEVWLDVEKATRLLPPDVESPRDTGADRVPCSCFLAEVVGDGVKVWSGTGHKRVVAEHRAGSLVAVYGEFGKDYFVGDGFMAKTSLRRVKDLTYPETGRPDWGLTDLPTVTVYVEGGRLPLAHTATGVSAYSAFGTVKNGDRLIILRELDGWAQVIIPDSYAGRGFVEKRYLDPDGDHRVPTAVVKTDHPLNRLNVRWEPNKKSEVEAKLCAGVRVQVVSSADGWTEIALYAEEGRWSLSGFVQSAYLLTGEEAERAEDACVRVRLTEEYKSYDAGTLPAGTEGTVIGVYEGVNAYYVRLDDGRIIQVRDSGTEPTLEPAGDSAWKAKTAKTLTLRSGPNSGSKKLGSVKSGATVEVLLRGEKWALVRVNGQTGYVLSTALKPKK